MLDFSNLMKQRAELTNAISTNNTDELAQILKSSNYINLNYVDAEGETPLHRSCARGNLEMVKLLVQHGANQSIKNKAGWFPIHLASFYGHMDIFLFLIDQNNFKHQPNLIVYHEESSNEDHDECMSQCSDCSIDKSEFDTDIFAFD